MYTSLFLEYVTPYETIRQMREEADSLYRRNLTHDSYLLAMLIQNIVKHANDNHFYAERPFGVCPFCGECEETVSLSNKSYGVCHEHRIYWYIGRRYISLLTDGKMQHPLIREILHSYSQIAIEEAFPNDVCLCCGLSRMHTDWCVADK